MQSLQRRGLRSSRRRKRTARTTPRLLPLLSSARRQPTSTTLSLRKQLHTMLRTNELHRAWARRRCGDRCARRSGARGRRRRGRGTSCARVARSRWGECSAVLSVLRGPGPCLLMRGSPIHSQGHHATTPPVLLNRPSLALLHRPPLAHVRHQIPHFPALLQKAPSSGPRRRPTFAFRRYEPEEAETKGRDESRKSDSAWVGGRGECGCG